MPSPQPKWCVAEISKNGKINPISRAFKYAADADERKKELLKKAEHQGKTLEVCQQVGNITYITDGVDLTMWNGTTNLPWGCTAPTVAPTLQQSLKRNSFWAQNTVYAQGQSLLDINGNVEYEYLGPGNSANTIPTWSVVLGGKITDNNARWQMVGVIARPYSQIYKRQLL